MNTKGPAGDPLAAVSERSSSTDDLAFQSDEHRDVPKLGSLRLSHAQLTGTDLQNTLLDDTLSVFSDFTLGDLAPAESSCQSPIVSHHNRLSGMRSVSFIGESGARKSRGTGGGGNSYFSASLYAKLEQLNTKKVESIVRNSYSSQPASPYRSQRPSNVNEARVRSFNKTLSKNWLAVKRRLFGQLHFFAIVTDFRLSPYYTDGLQLALYMKRHVPFDAVGTVPLCRALSNFTCEIGQARVLGTPQHLRAFLTTILCVAAAQRDGVNLPLDDRIRARLLAAKQEVTDIDGEPSGLASTWGSAVNLLLSDVTESKRKRSDFHIATALPGWREGLGPNAAPQPSPVESCAYLVKVLTDTLLATSSARAHFTHCWWLLDGDSAEDAKASTSDSNLPTARPSAGPKGSGQVLFADEMICEVLLRSGYQPLAARSLLLTAVAEEGDVMFTDGLDMGGSGGGRMAESYTALSLGAWDSLKRIAEQVVAIDRLEVDVFIVGAFADEVNEWWARFLRVLQTMRVTAEVALRASTSLSTATAFVDGTPPPDMVLSSIECIYSSALKVVVKSLCLLIAAACAEVLPNSGSTTAKIPPTQNTSLPGHSSLGLPPHAPSSTKSRKDRRGSTSPPSASRRASLDGHNVGIEFQQSHTPERHQPLPAAIADVLAEVSILARILRPFIELIQKSFHSLGSCEVINAIALLCSPAPPGLSADAVVKSFNQKAATLLAEVTTLIHTTVKDLAKTQQGNNSDKLITKQSCVSQLIASVSTSADVAAKLVCPSNESLKPTVSWMEVAASTLAARGISSYSLLEEPAGEVFGTLATKTATAISKSLSNKEQLLGLRRVLTSGLMSSVPQRGSVIIKPLADLSAAVVGCLSTISDDVQPFSDLLSNEVQWTVASLDSMLTLDEPCYKTIQSLLNVFMAVTSCAGKSHELLAHFVGVKPSRPAGFRSLSFRPSSPHTSGSPLGGDLLAETASNVSFATYTGGNEGSNSFSLLTLLAKAAESLVRLIPTVLKGENFAVHQDLAITLDNCMRFQVFLLQNVCSAQNSALSSAATRALGSSLPEIQVYEQLAYVAQSVIGLIAMCPQVSYRSALLTTMAGCGASIAAIASTPLVSASTAEVALSTIFKLERILSELPEQITQDDNSMSISCGASPILSECLWHEEAMPRPLAVASRMPPAHSSAVWRISLLGSLQSLIALKNPSPSYPSIKTFIRSRLCNPAPADLKTLYLLLSSATISASKVTELLPIMSDYLAKVARQAYLSHLIVSLQSTIQGGASTAAAELIAKSALTVGASNGAEEGEILSLVAWQALLKGEQQQQVLSIAAMMAVLVLNHVDAPEGKQLLSLIGEHCPSIAPLYEAIALAEQNNGAIENTEAKVLCKQLKDALAMLTTPQESHSISSSLQEQLAKFWGTVVAEVVSQKVGQSELDRQQMAFNETLKGASIREQRLLSIMTLREEEGDQRLELVTEENREQSILWGFHIDFLSSLDISSSKNEVFLSLLHALELAEGLGRCEILYNAIVDTPTYFAIDTHALPNAVQPENSLSTSEEGKSDDGICLGPKEGSTVTNNYCQTEYGKWITYDGANTVMCGTQTLGDEHKGHFVVSCQVQTDFAFGQDHSAKSEITQTDLTLDAISELEDKLISQGQLSHKSNDSLRYMFAETMTSTTATWTEDILEALALVHQLHSAGVDMALRESESTKKEVAKETASSIATLQRDIEEAKKREEMFQEQLKEAQKIVSSSTSNASPVELNSVASPNEGGSDKALNRQLKQLQKEVKEVTAALTQSNAEIRLQKAKWSSEADHMKQAGEDQRKEIASLKLELQQAKTQINEHLKNPRASSRGTAPASSQKAANVAGQGTPRQQTLQKSTLICSGDNANSPDAHSPPPNEEDAQPKRRPYFARRLSLPIQQRDAYMQPFVTIVDSAPLTSAVSSARPATSSPALRRAASAVATIRACRSLPATKLTQIDDDLYAEPQEGALNLPHRLQLFFGDEAPPVSHTAGWFNAELSASLGAQPVSSTFPSPQESQLGSQDVVTENDSREANSFHKTPTPPPQSPQQGRRGSSLRRSPSATSARLANMIASSRAYHPKPFDLTPVTKNYNVKSHPINDFGGGVVPPPVNSARGTRPVTAK